jgi:membrane protease YdiL (CAAX protease family)
MGMLSASVAFGVLWSLWHAPLALINGTYHNELARMDSPIYLANFFVSVVPLAVVANWIYYRQNRSILGNILFHSMANGAAVLVNATQVTKCIVTLVYLAIAVGLVVFDRAGFRQGPRNYLDYGKAGPPNG